MVTTHIEIEDKYDVSDDAQLPALDSLPGVASVDSERFVLEATYFDTADLRAARARITVRRRTGGADAGWHAKLPLAADADDGRREVRVPLGRAVHTVPKRLRDVLRAHLRDEPMTPVAVLHTDRTVHRLRDAAGNVLVELADDRVSAESVRRGEVRTWREWEVELVEGDRALLKAARKTLGKAGAEPSSSGSKLGRTLADLLPTVEAPPKLRRKGPAGDVVRARLAEQHAELLRQDPGVREDAHESVHLMRVATRRLRTALATYRPFLDRSVTDPLRDEMKWLAGVLGESRDASVQRHYLARQLDVLDDGSDTGETDGDTPGFSAAWAVVGARTEAWSAAARRDLLAALDSERYLALLDRLAELVDDPPLSPAAQRPVRLAMTRRVRQEWSRAVKRLHAIDEVDVDDRDEALHEARKAVKRLRYAVEPLVAVYGSDAKVLVKRLKKLQTRLGDHHDAVAAQLWLREAVADPSVQGRGAGFALGVLHERLEAVKHHEERRFEKAWHATSRPGLRAFLS